MAPRLETATAVGNTPSNTDGWRPTLAMVHPASAATHGNVIENSATFGNHGCASSLRRAEGTKNVAVSTMKNRPSPTMMWNDQ